MNLTPRGNRKLRGLAFALYFAVELAMNLAAGLSLSLALPGASHAAPPVTGASSVSEGSSRSQPRLRLALEAFGSLVPDDETYTAKPPVFVPIEDGGGGISLSAGYSINPSLELGLRFQGAAHRTTGAPVEYGVGSLLLEFRWFSLRSETVRPYVMTGLGGSNLVADGGGPRTTIRGETAAAGVGTLFLLTSHIGLDLAARWQWINWDEARVPVEVPQMDDIYTPNDRSGKTGQLGVGMSFFF